jgi:hypothetical protein
METISATGLVSLTESQLSLIRSFYPNAKKTQSVITTTYNDNNEGLTEEDVDVFWVAATEIAVTLNSTVIASDTLRKIALSDQAVKMPGDSRIAPNGQIYIAGKRSSMKEALALISERSKQADVHHMAITVCIAPPFASSLFDYKDPNGEFQKADMLDKAVLDTFQALAKHGEVMKIAVSKCW